MLNGILDKFVSTLIVFFSHTLLIFIWYYFYSNFESQNIFLLLYFPFGIVVLSYLFFHNKVIFGLLPSQIVFYLILKNYNLELPFNNYFILSLFILACIPISLFVLQKFNVTVGVGIKYKLDKTNIYHVLLITFISTIVLGTFIILTYVFSANQINLLPFIIGNFLGGATLILLMKLIINLTILTKSFIQRN